MAILLIRRLRNTKQGKQKPGIEKREAISWPFAYYLGVLEKLDLLSVAERKQAREAHKLWLANPRQPGLRFKKVHKTRPIYSVRINLNVRAVGVMSGEDIIWFWIGQHDEYEGILKKL